MGDRCKVADFGLSQEQGEDTSNDKDEKIPIRWTAPEAVLHHQFSIASDVWSFGILMWEMWSYGAMPYKGWTNDVVMAHVTKEYRMPAPKNCPQFIYGLMLECWNEDAGERPAFFDIFERLLACWNICKPMSSYAKTYTYDEAGNRVRAEKAYEKGYEKVGPSADDEMEEGDMYDLGGETDKQIVGKKRIVKDTAGAPDLVGESDDEPDDYPSKMSPLKAPGLEVISGFGEDDQIMLDAGLSKDEEEAPGGYLDLEH